MMNMWRSSGRATAELFHKDGAHVVLLDIQENGSEGMPPRIFIIYLRSPVQTKTIRSRESFGSLARAVLPLRCHKRV